MSKSIDRRGVAVTTMIGTILEAIKFAEEAVYRTRCPNQFANAVAIVKADGRLLLRDMCTRGATINLSAVDRWIRDLERETNLLVYEFSNIVEVSRVEDWFAERRHILAKAFADML